MKNIYFLKISADYTITLPKDIIKKMKLRKGSYLLIYSYNTVLIMIKINKSFFEHIKRLKKAKKRLKKSGKEDVFKVLERISSAKHKPSMRLINKVIKEVRARKDVKRK